MDDLRWINPKNYIIKEQILELENSGGTDAEIIDALKELDRDVRDTGNLDHLLAKTKEDIRAAAKEKSTLIYEAIEKIDKQEGELYLKHMDS